MGSRIKEVEMRAALFTVTPSDPLAVFFFFYIPITLYSVGLEVLVSKVGFH